MKQLTKIGRERKRSTTQRDDDDSDTEHRPRVKEAENVKVPSWPKVDTFSLWITQLTRNVNAAAARPDDKAIAWLNKARDKSCSFEDLATCEDRFQVLDRKLAKSLMEILPSALLNKITLKESVCLSKGYQLRGRQILMLICDEFKVNADIGFTYSLEDLSILAYTGDKNLQQFVNKWDTILAELEVDKIGPSTLARMFENKLMTSKLLESEVRHFRRLPAGHADKTYKWLRDMIDKVLQLEKEDKNQAALQASHRAPIGSYSNAATKGYEGKGGGDKKKGKGKGSNKKEGGKGKGGGTQANHLANPPPRATTSLARFPANSCTFMAIATKARIATSHTARQRRKRSRNMATRRVVGTAREHPAVPSLTRTSPALHKDKVCASMVLTASSAMIRRC